jgi:hypothetical protein
MSYTTDHLRTAGKITIYAALVGVFVFGIAFVFNLGLKEVPLADAQDTATTSVTVLNTPPLWTASTTEEFESSATNPTNAGNEVSWIGVATDSNAEDYYLLICSTGVAPTPNSGAAPSCSGGIQWAVSAATVSGTQARAATTSLAAWSESNDWFAWVCDGNVGTPRCNTLSTQGTNATNSSPFIINHRPTFSLFADDSPADPGQTVTFFSTSTDSDIVGTADTVKLIVCASAGFSTSTDSCTGTTLGSTTVFAASNATATYTIIIPTQDQNYSAFGYVIDNHGFEASGGAQGTDSTLTVSNVAPTVSGATISLTQPTTTDMFLTVESGETTGFTLSFVTSDNNSCDAAGGGTADEIVDYDLSIYRSGVGSTTCTSASGAYDANNCYPSGVSTGVWNLTCTAATSTTCSGSTDTDMTWNCTFPLWYIADPTDGTATSTQFSAENWLAQVRGIDDDAAIGSYGESDSGVDVRSFLAFALNTLSIPYGSLEPGQQTDPLNATTTISATGNVGLDKQVEGESMCTSFTPSSLCPTSPTSTIPESEQVFATSTVAYAAATSLSSSTIQEVEVNVHKSTSTSTQATASAYWGIRVPSSITFSGDYYGQNTFYAVVGESVDWGGP